MKKFILYGVMAPGMLLMAAGLGAKPPNIRPGLSYYAEEYRFSDGRYGLAEEKNLEEVFKNYAYYEAVYDAQERIKLFRAYKRGEVDFTERYFYDSAGKLLRKEVTGPDGERKWVEFAP